MKNKILLIIFLICMIGSLPAIDQSKLQEEKLLGQVYQLTEKVFTVKQSLGKWQADATISMRKKQFTRDGNIFGEMSTSFVDLSLEANQIIFYFYDNNGLIVREIGGDHKGNTTYKTIYIYDENKNNIEQQIYLKDDTLYLEALYTYDANGRVTEYVAETDDRNPYGLKKIVEQHVYNDENNSKQLLQYNSKEELIGKASYFYDSQNNLIEYNIYNSTQPSFILVKNNYKYNSKNFIIEELHDYIEEKKKVSYYYSYEYDEVGNWIKRVKSQRLHETIIQPIEIIEREIKYYE